MRHKIKSINLNITPYFKLRVMCHQVTETLLNTPTNKKGASLLSKGFPYLEFGIA